MSCQEQTAVAKANESRSMPKEKDHLAWPWGTGRNRPKNSVSKFTQSHITKELHKSNDENCLKSRSIIYKETKEVTNLWGAPIKVNKSNQRKEHAASRIKARMEILQSSQHKNIGHLKDSNAGQRCGSTKGPNHQSPEKSTR
ncbi:hypothetical protein AMTRI_Chr01g132550 [Amborella trichopoda]